MEISSYLCPIALFIGRRFSERRKLLGYSLQTLAQRVSISSETLSAFEAGEMKLDALLILQLEKALNLSYSDYRSPVAYFGFIGMRADTHHMLLRCKRSIKNLKRCIRDKHAAHQIEDSLLRLRFTPLRGKTES